jgi:peptidoglycan/LPS O-acetylase OafA/YrhL
MANFWNREDLPAQTSIRGLAAVLVFIAHSQFFSLFPDAAWARGLEQVFHWNNEAVDLFFLLSGFILYYVYGEFRANWRKYALARFSRIYPVYFISTAFFLGLAIVQYFTSHTVSDKISTLKILSNIFLIQSWPWPWPALSLNYPAWSISVEAFLYIFVFPVLFYSTHGSKARALPGWVLVAIVYLFMSFMWMLHREFYWMTEHQTFDHGFRNALLRGICGFISGYFLAVLASRWKFRFPEQLHGAEVVMLLSFVSLLIFVPPGAIEGLLLLAPMLVYAAAVRSSVTTRLFSFPPLVYLGTLSYSIYIWHAPVLAIFSRLFHIRDSQTGALFATPPSAINSSCYFIFSVTALLVVAHLSYFYFEIPVKAALREWTSRRAR